MTPELEKVMNEAAIKNANGLRNLERDFSIGDFKAGFFLAIAHLEKQAELLEGRHKSDKDCHATNLKIIDHLHDKIKLLEARLAEMTEKYNKAYGSYSKHFDAMIHNHKMYEEVATKLTAAEARIKEYSQLIRDKGIR